MGTDTFDQRDMFAAGVEFQKQVMNKVVVKFKIDRCEATGHIAVRALDDHDNLCESCSNKFPECQPSIIGFGNGLGYDNIIECNNHSALRADGNPFIQKEVIDVG